MKIAFFSDNFYPEMSGISDSIVLISQELAKLGHEVRFYVPRYSAKDYKTAGLEPKELDLGSNISICRLPSIPIFSSPTKQARFVFPCGLSLSDLKKFKPDIIHTHSPFGVGLEALIASKILKTKFVGTAHTPMAEFLHYSPIKISALTSLILRLFSWYYNKCEFVTAPSQGVLEEMKKNGFYKPCRVLSNPIDVAHFFPASAQEKTVLKQRFRLSNHTVLYTGRLATEKHIDIIIRAVAEARTRVPDIHLALTGYGNAEEDLRKLAEEVGLRESITFFGRVDDETHVQLYKASDVFVIMSTAETQSLSLMKAMSTGLPVIGANARALPEYIGTKCGYVVEPGDITELAKKIVFLFKNSDVSKEMGESGIQCAKKYSPESIAREWNSLYQRVLG
jgi:glycosyltransferase involved in cell wall biosynthesis